MMSIQIQALKFQKQEGSIDLQQAFDEIPPRALVIECKTFDYSFERFKNLAIKFTNTDTGKNRD